LAVRFFGGDSLMCFSAEASFGMGAALLPAGAYCVHTALHADRRYLSLAAFPVFFGAQQMFEGLVWTGLERHHADLVRVGSLGFLFFALAWWPFWIPVCAALLEPRRRVRRLLLPVAVLGLAWFWVLYWPLLWQRDLLNTRVAGHSIEYELGDGMPILQLMPRQLLRACYVLFVFLPLALASNRELRSFGLLLGASGGLTLLIAARAYVSVWCFFGALLSLYLGVKFAKVCAAEGAALATSEVPCQRTDAG
jgi:hypothetical protein